MFVSIQISGESLCWQDGGGYWQKIVTWFALSCGTCIAETCHRCKYSDLWCTHKSKERNVTFWRHLLIHSTIGGLWAVPPPPPEHFFFFFFFACQLKSNDCLFALCVFLIFFFFFFFLGGGGSGGGGGGGAHLSTQKDNYSQLCL